MVSQYSAWRAREAVHSFIDSKYWERFVMCTEKISIHHLGFRSLTCIVYICDDEHLSFFPKIIQYTGIREMGEGGGRRVGWGLGSVGGGIEEGREGIGEEGGDEYSPSMIYYPLPSLCLIPL